MKFFILFLCLFALFVGCESNANKKEISSKTAIKLSQDYLEKCKRHEKTDSTENLIAQFEFTKLCSQLNTDEKKMCFWLNFYNASIQKQLRQNSKLIENEELFFKQQSTFVAGEKFSLNDIENQILRRKKSQREIFNTLKVNKLDPRIHFALNCGAKSCPPILFYEVGKLEAQLDLATQSYLLTECEYKNEKLYLPMLFLWFKEDFGGDEGVFDFLRKYKLLNSELNPQIEYLKYDWKLNLGNYIF